MVHGGDPTYSQKLDDGLTKREQIRAALQKLSYVHEVVFALSPVLEGELFEKCEGTIILIERNPKQLGARDEFRAHALQRDVARKLFVFIPAEEGEPQGEGFFATLVRDRVKPLHKWHYSDTDYEECHLVQKATAFVEGLRIEQAEATS